MAGVRRDLGKKKTQKTVFLFPPASLDQILVAERCFPACREERKERKEFEVLRFPSMAELGINRAILDKPLCLGMCSS